MFPNDPNAQSLPMLPTTAPASGQRMHAWLTERRNNGKTPADVAAELVGAGWPADAAASTAMGSLRRSDVNTLLWFSLCWSAGLAAVGLTTGAHQLLSPKPDRDLAALSWTVALAMAPIAVTLSVVARRAEERSRFALWSPARRTWFGTLATCTAVVGLLRLLRYLYLVMSSVVGAGGVSLTLADLVQVLVTVSVAVPMFVWSFRQWRRSDVVVSGLRHDPADDAPPAS